MAKVGYPQPCTSHPDQTAQSSKCVVVLEGVNVVVSLYCRKNDKKYSRAKNIDKKVAQQKFKHLYSSLGNEEEYIDSIICNDRIRIFVIADFYYLLYPTQAAHTG